VDGDTQTFSSGRCCPSGMTTGKDCTARMIWLSSMSTAFLTRPLPVSDGREVLQTKSHLRCAIRCIRFPSLGLSYSCVLALSPSLSLSTIVRCGLCCHQRRLLCSPKIVSFSRPNARSSPFPWLCCSQRPVHCLSRYTSALLIPSLSAFRLHVCLFSLPFTGAVSSSTFLLYLASRQSSRSSLMNSLRRSTLHDTASN
jgi:hypothetical protein